MTANATYDIIIAGGGCAGLSLVYHLLQSEWKDRSILMIDREHKRENDRTWCFWETASGPFEAIVHQRWQQMYFHGHAFSQLLDIRPYTYKMIRGIDFYQYVHQAIALHQNITCVQAHIQEIREHDHGAEVITDKENYRADWVFSSVRDADEVAQAHNHQYLLQHFKGWEIRTNKPFFNPQQATLMDFRIEQHGDCRFMYVLPVDEQTALVEFTLFSAELLPADEYNRALHQYLQKYLQLHEGDYQIAHEEFGVIPMTDMRYPRQPGRRIIRIGTAGGATKASTGYTFQRIQQDSQQLVHHLVSGQTTSFLPVGHRRFALFDSVLLNVMGRHLYPAKQTFTHLFQKNPPARVLKFLDEDTRLSEDLSIMHSVPVIPFLKGTWHALRSL